MGGKKICLVETIFWVKKFWVRKKFGSKNFLGKKCLGSKKFWVKNVWVPIFFSLKKTGRVNPRGRIYESPPPENSRVKILLGRS